MVTLPSVEAAQLCGCQQPGRIDLDYVIRRYLKIGTASLSTALINFVVLCREETSRSKTC